MLSPRAPATAATANTAVKYITVTHWLHSRINAMWTVAKKMMPMSSTYLQQNNERGAKERHISTHEYEVK